jgi:hypothetical protein
MINDEMIFYHDWDMPDSSLYELLNLYNVGWIVVWSKDAKERLDERLETGLLVDRIPLSPYILYQTSIRPSYVIGAEGDVDAQHNRIRIQSDPGASEIILKYHWHHTLKSDQCQVFPIDVGTPVPFIRLMDCSSDSIEVYNSYMK